MCVRACHSRHAKLAHTAYLLTPRLPIQIFVTLSAINSAETGGCRSGMTSRWKKCYAIDVSARRVREFTEIFLNVFLLYESKRTLRVHGYCEQVIKAIISKWISAQFENIFKQVWFKNVCRWGLVGLARKPPRYASGPWVLWMSVMAKEVIDRIFS